MDGDDFSRATRLGRTAVAAIWDSISNGAPFDGFATGQLIDRFVGHADGIPSLQPILTVLAGLAAEPLFIQAGIADAIDRVDDAAAVADATMLDLQLRDVVTSSLLRNEIDPRPILERFFAEFIERTSSWRATDWWNRMDSNMRRPPVISSRRSFARLPRNCFAVRMRRGSDSPVSSSNGSTRTPTSSVPHEASIL